VRARTLVTLPGVHATQRIAHTALVSERRQAEGLPPLSPDAERREWENAVDLIMDGSFIQIRPDPQDMLLAFEADELLQELDGVSKRNIRFLYARRAEVQQAIRERGEYWRITPLPRSPEEIEGMIERARIGIGGEPIYYYNPVTGTRYLTLEQFEALRGMSDQDLLLHMREIQEYAARRNHLHHRELEFFGASGTPQRDALAQCDFTDASNSELRSQHARLVERFRLDVHRELRDSTLDRLRWRNRMFSCLAEQDDETISGNVLQGINPEFFRQIRWLPGGRIEHGELIFDPVFGELERDPDDAELRNLCDEGVKGFIFNYVREFGNLQYVNIGQVAPALRRRPRSGGERSYMAEVKHRGAEHPVLRIIRFQKWGIREHLDEGKDLLRAIMEAEEYTDFILDRRLGCWQLGMPLPRQILTRRIAETYQGSVTHYRGTRIWTTYFERDYIEGVATDKIGNSQLADGRFALAFATLLGRVAVPNLIVGRTTLDRRVIFDDGDEVVVLDADSMPREIIVADHAGTFTDWDPELERFVPGYARPVISRRAQVPDPMAFARAYTSAFEESLTGLQREYRKERRAFDTLFKHCKQDEGSFGWRWKWVLARLDATDVPALATRLREACGIRD